MAKKFELVENYLIITDTVTLKTDEFAVGRVKYNDNGSTISIIYLDDYSQNLSVTFADVLDLNGNPFASQAAFIAFLRVSTGFNSPEATGVKVSASGFNGNLTPADDTVQKVAEKFDDFPIYAIANAVINISLYNNRVYLDSGIVEQNICAVKIIKELY